MSKVTRNRLAAVLAGLSVGLLAQQASATEEIVVYGSASSVPKIEPAMFRAEIDNYVRTLNRELRTTLDQSQKAAPAPKVELANNTTPVRG
jgi:regulator of sirC expression with transglutaminase-like and TPR domain